MCETTPVSQPLTSLHMIQTITFPIDSENRQLVARKINGAWQLIERDTLRPNSTKFLEVDSDMAADLDRALTKQA